MGRRVLKEAWPSNAFKCLLPADQPEPWLWLCRWALLSSHKNECLELESLMHLYWPHQQDVLGARDRPSAHEKWGLQQERLSREPKSRRQKASMARAVWQHCCPLSSKEEKRPLSLENVLSINPKSSYLIEGPSMGHPLSILYPQIVNSIILLITFMPFWSLNRGVIACSRNK